jgi:hypothetical protein
MQSTNTEPHPTTTAAKAAPSSPDSGRRLVCDECGFLPCQCADQQ